MSINELRREFEKLATQDSSLRVEYPAREEPRLAGGTALTRSKLLVLAERASRLTVSELASPHDPERDRATVWLDFLRKLVPQLIQRITEGLIILEAPEDDYVWFDSIPNAAGASEVALMKLAVAGQTEQEDPHTVVGDALGVVRAEKPTKPSESVDDAGYVKHPSDLSQYIPASEIISDHCRRLPVTMTPKLLGEVVEEQKIRWTRPKNKKGKPRPNRRSIHLGDWRAYVGRIATREGWATDTAKMDEEMKTIRTRRLKKRPGK